MLSLQLSATDHLLPGYLLLVERREVVDDYRYRQSDDEDSADAAGGSDQLTPPRPRELVAVPDRCHGDCRPPERAGDADEVGSRLILLGEVDETGEDEDLDGEEHHEKAELLVAALERVTERLQPGRVAGQLQDAQDSKDTKQLDDTRQVVEVIGGVGFVDAEWGIVGHNGDQVDHVQSAAEKPASIGRRPQSHGVLECEPADTGRLQVRHK